MTLQRVAQLAGVSTSTVSRVLNQRRNVATETAAVVHKVMQRLALDLKPARRRGVDVAPGARGSRGNATALAFLVFGTSGAHPAPAFDRLLRGVSTAASQQSLELIFSFISDPRDPSALPRNLDERRIGGLLLHGERPSPAVQVRLERLPTVWLMANRQRPIWGDQVMPDNLSIGELAARYLLRRGHRRLAYLWSGTDAWWMPMRSLSFASAAADAGAHAAVLKAAEDRSGELWRADGLMAAARQLVQQLVSLSPAPTGVFIAEDRLLGAIDAMLHSPPFVDCAATRRMEIISCNNERPHLLGGPHGAVTIDIRAESIGQRGVEQLVWRMRNRAAAATTAAAATAPQRIRIMVEPQLVERNADATAVNHNITQASDELSVGLNDWCRQDLQTEPQREDLPSLAASAATSQT